jgi:hypothetical protein
MELKTEIMEYLSRWLYYAAAALGILITLFYFFNFIYNLFDPYKKTSEAMIFLAGSMIMGCGFYLSYRFGFVPEQFWIAVGILIGINILSIIWIFIGLFFFNGPIHWQ